MYTIKESYARMSLEQLYKERDEAIAHFQKNPGDIRAQTTVWDLKQLVKAAEKSERANKEKTASEENAQFLRSLDFNSRMAQNANPSCEHARKTRELLKKHFQFS